MMDQELPVKIGARIRNLRMKKNMTQNHLAMECDFEKASMSRIESGRNNSTLRTLDKICKALNVPIGELFNE
jgi:transcriptional regulator with XRE-family HTH domain